MARLTSWLVFLAALLSGCGGYTARRAGQAEAERLVWVGLYGMRNDQLPEVEWIPGKDVFGHSDGFTYAGWKVQVADKGGDGAAPISDSAFAHELMHFRTYLRTGDVDAAHWRGDWELANETAMAALEEVGL